MTPALLVPPSHHPIPRHPGSKNDLGPFLDVVTWILLITSGLAVLVRLITKRALRRRIDVDDAFVIAALLASIGSGISVSIQTSSGLGRNITELSASKLAIYQKSEYANKLLYIATLALAKLSIISLLMILTASELHRNMGIGLSAFIALWGVVSEFVAAFQCKPKPWNFVGRSNQCLDLVSFWRSMAVINMLTDLALILFPVHVIVTLQMSLDKKITILTFFGARSFDIIATAMQIVYLYGFSSPNPTSDLWKWTLVTQITQCITILTSCIPYLRPLLESLPSGLYGSDDLRRRGTPSELGYSRSKSGSYQLSSVASQQRPSEPKAGRKSSVAESLTGLGGLTRFIPRLSISRSHPTLRPHTHSPTTNTTSASGIPGGPHRPDGEMGVEISALGQRSPEERKWDAESTGSHSKILKTTVVSAEWEEAKWKSRNDGRGEDGIETVRWQGQRSEAGWGRLEGV